MPVATALIFFLFLNSSRILKYYTTTGIRKKVCEFWNYHAFIAKICVFLNWNTEPPDMELCETENQTLH